MLDSISTRSWMTIGLTGVLLFFTYWTRWNQKQRGWQPPPVGFSYEMPRPHSFEPGFDFSDRHFERQVKSLPALPERIVRKGPELDPKTGKPKVDEKKKAADAKKAAAVAAAKKAAEARKKKTQVDVVNTSVTQKMTDLEVSTTDTSPDVSTTLGGWGPVATSNTKAAVNAENNKDKEDDDLNLTPSQWRSLLQSAPTSENVSRFVRAKAAGKLDSATYYRIVHELLVDSAEDRRRAALSILDQDVSAGTYAFMVTESEQARADEQVLLKARIDTYSDVSRMGIMAQVLGTQTNETVLSSGLDRVASGLAQYQLNQSTSAKQRLAQQSTLNGNSVSAAGSTESASLNDVIEAVTAEGTNATTVGGNETNSGNTVSATVGSNTGTKGGVRGQSTTTSKPAQIQPLVAPLQKLTKHSNATIAAKAQTLLTQLQALLKSKS